MKGKYQIKNTKYNIFINCLSLILLIGISLYLILNWNDIPDKIPGHYNLSGVVDRWGSKNELWTFPITSVILYIGITILERFPQVWNTGIEIKEKNRDQVYRIIKDLLVTVKGVLVDVFVFLTANSVLQKSMPVWFLPVFLILVFGTIGITIARLLKVE